MGDSFKLDNNIIMKNVDAFTFNDKKEVYTNGADLIPVFRVEQIIEAMKLQELVDRATPKKPIKLDYKLLLDEGWRYECPICKCAIGINTNAFDYTQEEGYCPTCGQAIDWSNYDE